MPMTSADNPWPIERRRSGESLFVALPRWYGYVINGVLCAILLISALPYAPALTVVLAILYACYVIVGQQIRRFPSLLKAYRSIPGQIARSLVLIGGVAFLLYYLYTHTGYLRGTAGGGTLWLFLLLGTFALDYAGPTRLVFSMVGLASAAAFGLALRASSLTPGLSPLQTISGAIGECLWMFMFAFILHVMTRRAAAWYANVHSLNAVERDLMSLRMADDEGKLLKVAAERIAHAFEYAEVNVFLLEPDNSLRCVAGASRAGSQLAESDFALEGGRGVLGSAIRDASTRLANDVSLDGDYCHHPAFPQTQSELAAPIRAQGKVVGVLDVQSPYRRFFTEQDVAVMSSLANDLGTVLDNIRLHAEVTSAMESRRRILEIIERISRRVLSQSQLAGTLEAIVKEAHEELGSDPVMLYGRIPSSSRIFGPVGAGNLYQPEAVGNGTPQAGGLVHRLIASESDVYEDQVVVEAAPLQSGDVRGHHRYPPFSVRERIMSRAVLHLRLDNVTYGLMFLNYRVPHRFGAEDKATFQAFANLAALAILRAESHEDIQAVQRQSIAEFVHDDCLSLADSAARLIAVALRQDVSAQRWQNILYEARESILELASDLRYLSHGLLEGSTDSLSDEVERVATRLRHSYEIECSVIWHGETSYSSLVVVPEVALILREATYNAVRHGRASRITIEVTVGGDGLTIQVQDNGAGFSVPNAKPRGLANMQDRACRIGGSVHIQSAPQQGTQVRIVVPFATK